MYIKYIPFAILPAGLAAGEQAVMSANNVLSIDNAWIKKGNP